MFISSFVELDELIKNIYGIFCWDLGLGRYCPTKCDLLEIFKLKKNFFLIFFLANFRNFFLIFFLNSIYLSSWFWISTWFSDICKKKLKKIVKNIKNSHFCVFFTFIYFSEVSPKNFMGKDYHILVQLLILYKNSK